jgi:hypothetical protein
MAKPSTHNDGIRVLVCGSHRFEDRHFVFGMLNGFASNFDISAIISGPFSGADQIAKEWAKERGVPYESLNLPESDRMQLNYFGPERPLPLLVMKNDPVYRKGYERLRDSGATVLLAIPNPEGELGPTSATLKRMAEMIDIPCVDGACALHDVSAKMSQAAQAQPNNTPEPIHLSTAKSTV